MWPWNAATQGEVYLFHFHQPLGNLSNPRAQALHYCGFAEDLPARIAKQLSGHGAKIVAAAMERGISYDLYHWPACLAVEKLIKKAHRTALYCPSCAAAAGRRARPLPVPAVQLELPLEEFPELPAGRLDWLEVQIQRSWRSARPQLITPGDIDDLL
jgi:hypothetical protein